MRIKLNCEWNATGKKAESRSRQPNKIKGLANLPKTAC